MRNTAFINDGPVIREIPDHGGLPTAGPTLAPLRGEFQSGARTAAGLSATIDMP